MNVKFNNNEIQLQRSDLAAIRDMIPEKAHILDLGCGSGRLHYALKTLKHAKVMGVEHDQQKILECAARGIPVIHASLDAALTDFCDGSYDYVILSRTIQSVQRPDIILNEMLRIGKRGIVSYMNFGHINARIQMLFGHMPVNRNLPLPWYNTPTIRPGTASDFKDLCKTLDIKICKEIPLTNEGDYLRRMAVLAASMATLPAPTMATRFPSLKASGVFR